MENLITVKRRYLRKPARKIRNFIEVIKKKNFNDAIDLLTTVNREGVSDIKLLLKSARAIAVLKNLNGDDLIVNEVKVDQGPAMKRRWKRAKGSTTQIRKEFSHITLSLSKIKTKE